VGQVIADRLDELLAGYASQWLNRSAWASQVRRSRQAERAFSRWFADRFSGQGAFRIDDDLIAAQTLTPIIRQLLEDEVPTTIRRCNRVHRRMAIIMRAAHMREIAAEPDCLSMRQLTVLLLRETARTLDQYPISIKLDADELLDAAIIVRKGLLPTCTTCPYIRQTVAVAGEHCPAARLIGLDAVC
jgi:hypothetical protein